MSADLCFLSIRQASSLIRTGALSSVRLVQAYLDRIEAVDGRLHAYLLVTGDPALAGAERADAEIAGGVWRGPLHGIPIALKDNIGTAGIRTTCNSAVLRDNVPSADAACVAGLGAGGAIVLGKLAMWEFATGGAPEAGDTPWPPARNPWNLACSPGGSSSGSAAAVAAGLCAAALGTDTGGSLRNPAAWCGVAGFKPTYDLVSRRGVIPLAPSLDHVGPMARSSADCALVLEALAGGSWPAAGETHGGHVPASGHTGFQGVRIGVPRHFFEEDAGMDAEPLAAFERALNLAIEGGASVTDVRLRPFHRYQEILPVISRTESFSSFEPLLRENPDGFGKAARASLMAGASIDADDYQKAVRERQSMRSQLAKVFEHVDMLMLPMARTTACALEDDARLSGISFYDRPFNLTGNPALTVCNGYSGDGLPLSVQFVGRWHDDPFVLRIGQAFERAAGFCRRPQGV